jgi:DNA-binding beta-propeller fold protein YncE
VTVCANNLFSGCGPGTDGVSVFDTSTCNATTQAGCDQLGTLDDGNRLVIGDAVDAANDTLYTANGDNTVSAFDLRHCNASDLAACATDTPGVLSFPGPQPGFDVSLWVAVDPPQRSVYVSYLKDDSVIVVDADVCNGSNPAGCATLHPPVIHAGSEPEILTLDPQTQTLYTVNQLGNDVSVIDAARCNAQTTGGCRHLPAMIPISAGALATDPAVHTAYITSGDHNVAMIDTRTCNSRRTAGCTHTPRETTVGEHPSGVAVDPRTRTVYVANAGSGSTGTVSVMNARTCNATDSAGCGGFSTLQVPGGNPDDVEIDSATDTIYVATITGSGPDLVSVFNGTICNATNALGCDQRPATVAVGNSSGVARTSIVQLAVNQATNTIYASNVYNIGPVPPPFLGNTVYVIDGATCDAANTTGCGHTPAAVTLSADPPVGSNPWGIAVDQATDTIYTANIADGEHPGTVSVINGAICNGQNTSGCDQTPALAPAGFGTVGIAVDQATNHVYATNTQDTSVTTSNGKTCNGTTARGCDHTRTRTVVGDYPGAIAVDPTSGTGYVTDSEGVSVISLNH